MTSDIDSKILKNKNKKHRGHENAQSSVVFSVKLC